MSKLLPLIQKAFWNCFSHHHAYVPVLWLYEVTAVLAKSQRTGTMTAEKTHGFLEDLRSLDIMVDEDGFSRIFGAVHRLAVDNG